MLFNVKAIPFELRASGGGWTASAHEIHGRASARSDLFVDPGGDSGIASSTLLNARTLLGAPPDGDFTLEARVDVEFASTFDAGVLLAWVDESHWAKLCFELSPARERMVVSVVTRGLSDDANAFTVQDDHVRLRISRVGQVIAFHARDGETWALVRAFSLPHVTDGLRVGFEVQSPTGDGCQARFSDLAFHTRRLHDIRDGS